MAESTARRRGRGEDAIYFDAAKNRYVGAVSLGFGPDGKRIRRKVTGRTKQDVRDKLKTLHAELDRGLRTSSAYTVRQAVADWLAGGMPGRTERTRSVYKEALTPLLQHIGAKPLKELTAGDVRAGLEALSGRYRPGTCRSPRPLSPGRSGTPRRTTSWGGTWRRSSTRLRARSGSTHACFRQDRELHPAAVTPSYRWRPPGCGSVDKSS
jgi:hypothetical protein